MSILTARFDRAVKNSPYTLLVFDWDGTLIDSEAKIIAMLHAASDDFDLPRRPDADIRNIIGLGLPVAMEQLFPEQHVSIHNKIIERYRDYFNAAPSSKMFPGVPETLNTLRENGFRMAIATGKSRRGLDKDLSNTDLWKMFHTTRCADETSSKPDPRMLHEIMEQLATEPKNTLMIGDTDHDLKMAGNAGVDAVAVTYGVQQ
ncbi:MAG: HAD-IA family hydrolase, partial [Gammaproteobacteria bacterium]|nr:HAD-IA family hydrolase [Gammaproteobacteria bacterium]NNJ85357.1 HAD-IA family hydrolase [Gammaproteobacteria bacterium]